VETEGWYESFVGSLNPKEMFGFVCGVENAKAVAVGIRKGMRKAGVSGRIYVQVSAGVWSRPFEDL
jgi:hypothetical protein